MKKRLSLFLDYAFGKEFEKHPAKSFFAAVAFCWTIAILASYLLGGIGGWIATGKFINAGFWYCLFLFAGVLLVYPFVFLIMRGSDETWGYSFGFYYGTLGLAFLFHKMQFIKNDDMEIFIAAVICAAVCVAVYFKRKVK